MRRKIVAITSQYLKEPISQIVSELKLNCDIQVVSYNKFDTISEVYDSYAGDTDGFLISGKIAKAAIESTAHAYNRPIVSFEIDIAGLYRALLNLLISNRDLDMDRIILDFLIPIDGGCTATAFLKELDIDTVPPHINNWTKALTRTSISTIENHVLSELIRMWNNNEMDMVLCQYSNILPELRAHGIPTIYPLPSVSHIRDLANELLSTIELEHMRSNLPVIINVSPRSSTDNTPENIQQIYVCMEDFFKKNLMNCIPQEVDNHCSALTTVEILQHITHNNKVCELNEFLTDKLHFECAVGYGIGANFDNAIRNSVNARKEAQNGAVEAGSSDPVSEAITRGLGGKKNISDVDCCATRLRITVHDAARVNDEIIKTTGSRGIVKKGQGVQIIYGPQVTVIKSKLEDYLETAPDEYYESAAVSEENSAEENTDTVNENNETQEKVVNTIVVSSPITGMAGDITTCPDEGFAGKMMGDGAVVTPEDAVICAPEDGEVLFVFETKHALGFQTESGLGMLLHIGIDTVSLNGEGFEVFVENGQKVKKGDPLMKIDIPFLTSHAPSLCSPVLCTELEENQRVRLLATGEVKAGDPLFAVDTVE